MDLKQNQITVGQLLADPRSRSVLQKKLPAVLKHPLTGAANTVTLEQLLAFAGAYLPAESLNRDMGRGTELPSLSACRKSPAKAGVLRL